MPEDRFSKSEQQQITDAISAAEQKTSGEIRVHIESHCREVNILDRAAHVFAKLAMHKTELRNGILLYIALDDHRFAVIGDKGIHARVPEGFWELVVQDMKGHFIEGRILEGILAGVRDCGDELAKDFPVASDDRNELSNEISFGE